MVICYIILSFLLSISLASIVIPRILLVSYKKKLFDVPNRRKVHKVPIPRLGGVSFFPVLLISLGLSMGVRFLLHCPIIHLNVDILFVRFMFLVVGLTMLYPICGSTRWAVYLVFMIYQPGLECHLRSSLLFTLPMRST